MLPRQQYRRGQGAHGLLDRTRSIRFTPLRPRLSRAHLWWCGSISSTSTPPLEGLDYSCSGRLLVSHPEFRRPAASLDGGDVVRRSWQCRKHDFFGMQLRCDTILYQTVRMRYIGLFRQLHVLLNQPPAGAPPRKSTSNKIKQGDVSTRPEKTSPLVIDETFGTLNVQLCSLLPHRSRVFLESGLPDPARSGCRQLGWTTSIDRI